MKAKFIMVVFAACVMLPRMVAAQGLTGTLIGTVKDEQGEHRQPLIIPTGIRYVDDNGQAFQTVSRDPAIVGGQFKTAALFVSDSRLSSQSLVDLRLSRTILSREAGRVELLVDVFNVLNDTAEEMLASDVLVSPNFGRPSVFMDPRRAMFGVRLYLGAQ